MTDLSIQDENMLKALAYDLIQMDKETAIDLELWPAAREFVALMDRDDVTFHVGVN